MVPTAVLLDASPHHRGTMVRRMGFCAAGGFALLALAAVGVALHVVWLVAAGAIALALPLGVLSVLSVTHILAWMPGAAGLAVALVNVAVGLGSMAAAALFQLLLDVLPVPHALAVAAAALAVFAAMPSALLHMPAGDAELEMGLKDVADTSLMDTGMTTEMGGVDDEMEFPRVSWRELAGVKAFWVYVICVASCGAAFPLVPYFFQIGSAFGTKSSVLLRWFQGGTLLSIVFNLGSLTLSDVARTRTGPFSSGARNLAAVIFIAQSVAFVVLARVSKAEDFVVWAVAATVQQLMFQSAFGVAVLLAVDMFGVGNMAVVFGVGGGLSLGLGQGIATMVMSMVHKAGGNRLSPSYYRPFYIIGACWSLSALVALMFLRRYRK